MRLILDSTYGCYLAAASTSCEFSGYLSSAPTDGERVLKLPASALVFAIAIIKMADPAAAQSVYRVPLDGNLSYRTSSLIEQAIAESGPSGTAAIVLEFDLDGDDLELALQTAHEISQSPVPIYAFVEERAWNAAALLALASDSIYIKDGATLGANGPYSMPSEVKEDTVQISAGDLFARYAQAIGGNPSVGRAMVDSTVDIQGVSDATTRLSLNAEQAVELGLAVAVAENVDEMLNGLGLGTFSGTTVDENWLATTVRIENRNWQDINIFVVMSGGSRLRLGTVTSNSSARYTLAGRILLSTSYFQVVAELIGSDEGIVTEIIHVTPGLVIEWNIENVLRNSNYFIWVRT